MGLQHHQSNPSILNRRTLEHDHSLLSQWLQPGMRVLDVGCGTGAITAGIARKVAPDGDVVGLDRDATLVEIARQTHADEPNLRFESGDVLELAAEGEYDIADAARVLQWIDDPGRAVVRLAAAVRPGGRVVALDYNHAQHTWSPAPPPEFRRFWDAFLAWRGANGWDNRMADRLPELFQAAGLREVESHDSSESGDGQIWLGVVESLGGNVVDAGYLSAAELEAAAAAYRDYRGQHIMVLRTVSGMR